MPIFYEKLIKKKMTYKLIRIRSQMFSLDLSSSSELLFMPKDTLLNKRKSCVFFRRLMYVFIYFLNKKYACSY